MRRRSVKVRLTIWYTALMVLMAALVLAFVAMISSSVASQSSRTYLSQVVRGNLDQVSLVDGSLQLGEEFTFLQDGVYTVVYSQSGALLAGQLPQPFSTVSEPFVNGLTRPVDTRKQTAERGGREIPLLPKEFAILEHLIRNKGVVISREQLEDRIWNYEYTGSSNNVDVYMSRLRKKLDEGFDTKLIHTVRGAGWVLREEAP